MGESSTWREMKNYAFEAFKRDGRISVSELEKIVDIGCTDGDFDEQEKAVLIDIITNLTGAEISNAMWIKIDELIHKFDLHFDSEAVIEHLDEEEEI